MNDPPRTSGLAQKSPRIGFRGTLPEHLPRDDLSPCISRSQSGRETGDELLDAGQGGLLIAREDPVIGAVDLDEPRLRDVAGEMPAGAVEVRASVESH